MAGEITRGLVFVVADLGDGAGAGRNHQPRTVSTAAG